MCFLCCFRCCRALCCLVFCTSSSCLACCGLSSALSLSSLEQYKCSSCGLRCLAVCYASRCMPRGFRVLLLGLLSYAVSFSRPRNASAFMSIIGKSRWGLCPLLFWFCFSAAFVACWCFVVLLEADVAAPSLGSAEDVRSRSILRRIQETRASILCPGWIGRLFYVRCLCLFLLVCLCFCITRAMPMAVEAGGGRVVIMLRAFEAFSERRFRDSARSLCQSRGSRFYVVRSW